jgi:hypothetical protein
MEKTRISHTEEDLPSETVLPGPSAYIRLKAWQLSEMHNSRGRFFCDFQDLAQQGGHEVVVTASHLNGMPGFVEEMLEVCLYHLRREGGGSAVIYERMMSAPILDVDTPAFDEVYRLIVARKATEAHKWARYTALYKVSWGIDKLTLEFLKANGHRLENPKARLARRILVPHSDFSSEPLDPASSGDMERAAITGRVCEALGLLSIFDNETELDIMSLTPKLRALPYFQDGNGYTAFARAFAEANTVVRDKRAAPTWENVGYVVKSLNVMFAFLGLKLECSGSERCGSRLEKRVRSYTHQLSKEGVDKLKYLVRLKARGMKMKGILNDHAREVVSVEDFGRWNANIDNKKSNQNPWRFVGPA